MSTSKPNNQLPIHVGKITGKGGKVEYLFLREKDSGYTWYHGEEGTSVAAPTIEEAIRRAHREWKLQSFQTLNCGFRYTLPERDEHGVNALFHEMIASYSTPTGTYFDPKLGHNCHIKFASQEALRLWKNL